MPLKTFHPAVAAWFTATFPAPTQAQVDAWPVIQAGEHVLVAAPTGSGKTLTAFLAAIDDLVQQGLRGELADLTQVIYVSPLKALSNDIRINLDAPLAGIRAELARGGLPDVDIRTAVRTGDTPQRERVAMRKQAPHILVTTPESLYVLLGSESGRVMLGSTRTVIVDEIHAIAGSKRGSHLALSLERLQALCDRPLQRIGLSATQKPIETVARFLVGCGGEITPANSAVTAPTLPDPSMLPMPMPMQFAATTATPASLFTPPPTSASPASHSLPCTIIDSGHTRHRDLALEVPPVPLGAVMSNDTWELVYNRLHQLIQNHRTTLIFVNTRRMAERAARHLGERLGKDAVAAHHGSLAKELRLDAEQRLKAGQLQVLVATASLELGIDIGDVDLVCQLGSPRSIAAFLQRVGRAGHAVGATPKGRLFPQSRDDLVECTALLDCVRRGELDALTIPPQPLDVLSQQIVAEVACREWDEDALYALVRRAWPYRDLARSDFDAIVRMLAEGFTNRRGIQFAYVHRDAVHKRLRERRGARLTAISAGGTIPDTGDYAVMLEPQAQTIGSVNEDFAIESMAGDIFQLGNTSYRILKIERDRVHVEDAQGAPPTIPFWLGEAPGRSDELSFGVSRLRETLAALLQPPHATLPTHTMQDLHAPGTATGGGDVSETEIKDLLQPAIHWLQSNLGLDEPAARQLAEYLAHAQTALGVLPTQRVLAMERFFDESGGTQLIIHSPYGSHINRAWGLALRKRFCRNFNFELQAAATEDAIVLSLSTSHSFPLADVARFLHSSTAADVLVQALLDAPLFGVRWRWNATTALALPRFTGGKKVAPQLQRMKSEDLLATVFPDQVACQENLVGEREVPDHPLVAQTLYDCLHEAMDVDGFLTVLRGLESGHITMLARDLTSPSPLAAEVLGARPYAFLDDAPLEERRTQAVQSRRYGDAQQADDLGRLDAEAIDAVRGEAWPDVRYADEMHEALNALGFITAQEASANTGWVQWLQELLQQQRATRCRIDKESSTHVWLAAERLPQCEAIVGTLTLDPPILAPDDLAHIAWSREDALRDVLRGRLNGLGPSTALALAAPLQLPPSDIEQTLLALESEGYVMRGRFTPEAAPADAAIEWCERHLLARIHRYTLGRLRREIEPVEPRDFMRFLFDWQHVAPATRVSGPDALAAVLAQLEGFEAPAAAWESELLPARVDGYSMAWLDDLCLAGRIGWARLHAGVAPATARRARQAGPIRSTPITLLSRRNRAAWTGLPAPSLALDEAAALSSRAQRVADWLGQHGASFFDELLAGAGLLRTELEDALAELVARGVAVSDSFSGLRALLVPASKRQTAHARRGRRVALFGIEDAGRWTLTRRSAGVGSDNIGAATTPLSAPLKKPRAASARASSRANARSKLAIPITDPDTLDLVVRTLLRRYGVINVRLLEREADWLPPWREMQRVLHRLEARGEIRGGRFIAGLGGEQFALPEAIPLLRRARTYPHNDSLTSLSGSDPLNLVGSVLAGARIPRVAGSRVVYRDGVPIATRTADKVELLMPLPAEIEQRVRRLLRGDDIGAESSVLATGLSAVAPTVLSDSLAATSTHLHSRH